MRLPFFGAALVIFDLLSRASEAFVVGGAKFITNFNRNENASVSIVDVKGEWDDFVENRRWMDG